MEWVEGDIEGVELRPARKHEDPRGWLAEVFRSDEVSAEALPVMSYVSVTHPGVTRGPHEHTEQTDTFAFFGPGNFKLRLWDNRSDSSTYGRVSTTVVGADNPTIVVMPPGVVHAYTNVSDRDAPHERSDAAC